MAATFTLSAAAADVDPSAVARTLARHYLDMTPAPAPPSLSLEQARRVRERYVAALGRVLGPAVGYKAGLTSPAAQRRFGVTRPVRGTLLEGMLLGNGARLAPPFAVRPMVEADLLVRVGDPAINRARTPAEALAALDSVMPFLEIPDLMYRHGVRIGAAELVAVNVGARYGVRGRAIPLAPAREWFDRLAGFRVTLAGEDGRILAQGRGGALLGHPLNVVLWLRDSLAAEGRTLRTGDLLSLGSLTPLFPVTGPGRITALYEGLDPAGPVSVTVTFR